MMTNILIGLAVLLVLFLILVALQPADFQVLSMDQMIGGQFEQGLASLKSIVEADPES